MTRIMALSRERVTVNAVCSTIELLTGRNPDGVYSLHQLTCNTLN